MEFYFEHCFVLLTMRKDCSNLKYAKYFENNLFELVTGGMKPKIQQTAVFLQRTIDIQKINSFDVKPTILNFCNFPTNFFIFQRGGCVHGEELNYIFGYPLLRQDQRQQDKSEASGGRGRSGFQKSSNGGSSPDSFSFSRNEANLGFSIIQFWANFAATG